MSGTTKIGIIICDRYRRCAGGKCFRAMRNREGAFNRYADTELELVGYPPCPYIGTFKVFLESRYDVEVVVGTHPIPARYLEMHTRLGTWDDPSWEPLLEPTMADEATRKAYN